MKVLTLILFSILVFPIVGQVSNDVRLVDEFDPRQGCENFEIRLDALFTETSNSGDPRSKAYVVIHQGSNAFDNAIVQRKATSYAHIRNFPPDRYVVLLTKGTGDIKVDHWVGKNGKVPPVVSANLDIVFRDGGSRILLLEDTIEMVRIDGRETYIGTGNPSCLYWFNSLLVWELLSANPAFDAEFLIKTNSSRRYRQLVTILRKKFLTEKAPIGRLKFVYGGTDKELEGSAASVVSIRTSFVKNVRK